MTFRKHLALVLMLPPFFFTTLCGEKLTPKNTAVVVIDVQGDFTQFKNGSLAVPNSGENYVELVKRATEKLKKRGFTIDVTQDWHPKNHISFFTNHPGHKKFEPITIQFRNEEGLPKTHTEFYEREAERLGTSVKKLKAYDKITIWGPENKDVVQILWPPHCIQDSNGAKILLPSTLIDEVIQKGTRLETDSYSGFEDDGGQVTDLDTKLKNRNIKYLIIYGIATDYCVQATVEHGLKRGYKVYVIENLCRGVADETSKAAIKNMKAKGAIMVKNLDDLIKNYIK